MDVSIIIPSYNTKTLLDRCLQSIYTSLSSSKIRCEIIVVDNASKDGSRELLNKKYPQVIKILNKSNIGYGKANNVAIRQAKGEYILLLNSDIEVQDNAIESLLEFARKKTKAFIGGKLINENGTAQPSCGPFPTLGFAFLMLFCKGDQLGLTRSSPDKPMAADWVSGACLLGKKESFMDVGLFDEGIFLYMEEVDLLYRARQKGYTTIFYPLARFTHTGAASSGSKKRPVLQIFQGLLYFYRKHRSIMEQGFILVLLRLKARIAILLGKITGNIYLTSTYEEALQLVKR